MKKVEAILRPQKLTDTIKALQEIGVTGFTVSQVVGRGRQKDLRGVYRGHNYTVNLHPKVKLEIVLSDYMVPITIKTIIASAQTGEDGDGKIFVTPVLEAYNIRSGMIDDTIDELKKVREGN
ncbi:P-II family nitrogen regulator [Microaerobacter geothermalis]|uniref:P-II family nitrogen regulator n=1 Tax=Microaerobacter geothermalis TaxID=674972 RepID=UPI001F263A13|nr:P-II family nitrogen regulator [Microaerobacter geothermalis]MCF6094282.1 P-II family nitrogen regulator [Microaerobacter geothermalis]